MNRNPIAARFKQVTFKKRMIAIYLLSILIPFLCLGSLSFYTIDSIIANKVEGSIQSALKQEVLALENTLNNLNHVSQQLAFGGGTNRLLEQLQHETDPYEQIRLRNEMKSELNVITFSNPNVGLTMYYYPDTGAYDFENFAVRDRFDPKQLPVMAHYPEITYYGPHPSKNRSINQLVFSTMRKVQLPEQNVYLFIETGFNATKSLFGAGSPAESSRRLLILDNDGRIAFSQDSRNFRESSLFPGFDPERRTGSYGHYVWHMETSNQGWSIVSVLPKEEWNKEKNRWLFQFTGILLLFVLAAILVALLLWKMVYKPLDQFNTEIKSFVYSDAEERTDLTFIPEFDYVLNQIRSMKRKIWELYGEIGRKEKRRADLEVEKLLYQINPHFLMNTLDTVHWLAMMSGQKEIDRLVLSLNKLLHYNLGKMGEATTIGAEIQALREYLQLQQIRYDFQFDVDIAVDDGAMGLSIPRFILQPLVENALYHGVSDDGYIHVDIRLNVDLEIRVQDNGAGMPQDKIDRMLREETAESRQVGMGIGMKYVKRILEANYGGRASFEIKSEIGQGTVVALRVPVSGGEETDDSRADR